VLAFKPPGFFDKYGKEYQRAQAEMQREFVACTILSCIKVLFVRFHLSVHVV
jgi:hypothetical protein